MHGGATFLLGWGGSGGTVSAAGTADGVGTATGAAAATGAASGLAAAVSTVLGVGFAIAAAVGSAQAVASANGVAAATVEAIGGAAGVASASGTGVTLTTISSVGSATAAAGASATGIGFGISASDGSAAAIASASAEGSTLSAGTPPTLVQISPSGGGTSQPTADLAFASDVTSGNVLIVSLTQASTSNRTWSVALLSGTATLGTAVTRITASSADRKAVLFEIPVTGTGSCTLRLSNDNGSSQNIRAIAYELSECVYDAASSSGNTTSTTSHSISASGALDTSGSVLLVAALCVSANDSSTLSFAASPSGWSVGTANARHISGTKSSSTPLTDEAPLVTSVTSLVSVGAIGAWRNTSSTSAAVGSAAAVASASAVGEFIAGRRGRVMWAELQTPAPTDNWLEVSWIQLTIPTAMKGRCHWLQLSRDTEGLGRCYQLHLSVPVRNRWPQLFATSPTSRQTGALETTEQRSENPSPGNGLFGPQPTSRQSGRLDSEV